MLTGHDVPAAGGGDATKERNLAIALQSGIIGQNDHDTQLRSERNRLSSTTPAAAMAPTRMQQDGKVVLHGAKLWERIGEPFASLDAAKQAMHRTEHGGNKAKWAANQMGCKRYWHCNFHEQCPVLLRISDQRGQGKWHLEVLNVEHGLHLKERQRKNSALTYEENAHVQQLVSQGQKPREIMEASQLAAIKAGAPKLPCGGVAGGCGISMYRYCIGTYRICIDMYRICIDMYCTCIDVYRACMGMYRSRIGMYRQHRLRHASSCTTG